MAFGHFIDRKVVKPVLKRSGLHRVLGNRGAHGVRKAFRFFANPHRTLERSYKTKGFFRPAAKVLHNFDLPQAWRKVKGWVSHAANNAASGSVGTSQNSATAVQTSPRYTLDYRYRRLSDLS